jgi:1-deoxyxylulose-5-phosphate synthase
MDKITLRHTDLTVSRIVMGTMTFGGQTNEPAAIRMVERCLDAGINFFDTANSYNNGVSEMILGKALAGRRHRAIVASKVFNKWGDEEDQKGLSRAAIMRAVEATLNRLGMDYLDVYYFHQPDYATPIEESLHAMDQLVKEGKVRYPASSNFAGWQVVHMLWHAEKNGYKPAVITQPMYNVLARGIEQEYLPMVKQFGLSTIVYNPLAGGLLTGKQERQEPLPGTRFDKNRMYLDRYWHDEQFDAVEALRAVAEQDGRSLTSLSLNWLLRHSPADCVIVGASRMEQLEENLDIVEHGGPLSENALRTCDVVWDALRGVAPKYNR